MFTIRVSKKLFILFLVFLLGIVIYFLTLKTQQAIPPLKTSLSNMGEKVLQSQTVYAAVDFNRYTQSPYNLPAPTEKIEPNQKQIDLANLVGSTVNKYQNYLSSKYEASYVDPFLSVIWVIAIEGLETPYFWNCQDSSYDINAGCPNGYYSGGWQVGFGIQVSQAAGHMVEDFNAAYGDGKAEDAAFVKEKGQAVIQAAGITNPSSFPSQSLSQLVSAAESGDTAARQAIAVLLMDTNLGAIAIAREVAGDIGATGSWRSSMERWGSYYVDNMQRFSNRAAGIAEKYSGVSSNIPGGGSGGGSFTLSLVLKPTKDDVYVTNIATAYAIGGTGGTGSSSAATDGPVNPDATCPGEGPITCGTRAGSSQASACHCTASYEANVTGCNGYCSWCHPPDDGAVYAIDIANPLDAPVFIPKISVGGEVRTVTCIGYGNQSGSTEPNQVIQILSCSDDKTDEAVWMQFHHSKRSNPVTEGKTYKSGETVGYSAAMEVFASDPHVHYQIGVGGPCGAGGTASCRNADQYVQCN